MHLRRGKQGPASTIGMGVAPAPGLTKEALINPSRIARAAKTKKCDFSFSLILNGLQPWLWRHVHVPRETLTIQSFRNHDTSAAHRVKHGDMCLGGIHQARGTITAPNLPAQRMGPTVICQLVSCPAIICHF